MRKPIRPPHDGLNDHRVTFDDAYNSGNQNPSATYYTTGNGSHFKLKSSIASKGPHSGDRVVRFMKGNKEMARAYECCWKHVVNCNRTYIACYVDAL